LRSTRSEIRGNAYINRRFHLDLIGELRQVESNGVTCLHGQADLEITIELPPALQFTPKSLIETTGNSLLRSVLSTMKQRLLHKLLSDYEQWAVSQQLASVTR
ncbi:MAG: DUF1997 domain-containing protein, partial [Cyanothece sp. SIO1E1]|nr:DUF1997 domain-containing protein [Cyanothece sp. SIO1E1]